MIDMTKQYRTRDGREVRIYAVEQHEVHGAIKINGQWSLRNWYLNGAFMCALNRDLDLIEVRPKRTLDVWLNIYDHRGPGAHISKEHADDLQGLLRVACLHIVREYEEGDGL